jgi:16S rRNA (guanine(966)-N(2))-methyltransferase RsmD
LRIIAGSARGRKLFAPTGLGTRPTTDRVRESLFQILAARLDGAAVLDLFAGSGALALEALSRGAASAVLNDADAGAVRLLKRNVEAVRAQERVQILALDYRRALKALAGQRFSLVFLDPPYEMTGCYREIAGILSSGGMLDGDGLIVMEHARKDAVAEIQGYALADERNYGDTAVSMYRLLEAKA